MKRLTLPPLKYLNEYLRAKVGPFFRELRESQNTPKLLNVDEKFNQEIIVQFSITHNPKESRISGSYSSYTSVTDIESHVLWRRLIDKSLQFASATEKFPRVLFVCDAGCEALKDLLGGASQYHLDELIGHFWRRPEFSDDQQWSWLTEKDISAIIVLSIDQASRSAFDMIPRRFVLKAKLFTNPHCSFPIDGLRTNLLREVVSETILLFIRKLAWLYIAATCRPDPFTIPFGNHMVSGAWLFHEPPTYFSLSWL